MRSSSDTDLRERNALIELSFAHGVGPHTSRALREQTGSYAAAVERVTNGSRNPSLENRRKQLEERTAACGARLVSLLDADYPQRLLHLGDPPPYLVLQGCEAVLDRACVAIVGVRTPTRYGERVAHELGLELGRAGACIISGLARGIDAAAHRGALDAGGTTCAVLGTGIDVSYPAGHAPLQRAIAKSGLLISEVPPGARPSPGSFPKRNRIIAALAGTIIVVEAGERSGALITARHGADLGVTVAGVPGPIDSAQSVGVNNLLRDGAHVITSVDDALFLAGLRASPQSVAEDDLPPLERSILALLVSRSACAAEIVEAIGAPATDGMTAITTLEMRGLIQVDLTGSIRRASIRRAKVPL